MPTRERTMAGGTEFNRGKFKELVIYMSQASAEDEGFGMVKLNKLLYRADFEAFRRLGRSITGETYQKEEWGPIAHDLLPILGELENAGRLTVASVPAGPHTRRVPTPSPEPDYGIADLAAFSDEEREVIEDTLRELAVHGGRSVSEWSHETSAGWRVKQIGAEIPYSSAVINLTPLSPESAQSIRNRITERLASA